MSVKDRLTKKTEGLLISDRTEGAASNTPSSLRTAPGQMLMVNTLMKENNKQVALLEQRLKEFEGVLPVRLIDANLIIASKWANRTEDSFISTDFKNLRAEIAHANGNVQPIKVRPSVESSDHFEIIFGHRRHRACLDLGLPVLALVEHVDDKELFREMERENRNRLDLSPWEQGRMYKRSLTDGLFVSLGELSKEIGIDKGNLSKALRLAELPDVVVNAFHSPLDLQYRWAKLLSDAIQKEPDEVFSRAAKLSANRKNRLAPKEILEILLGIKSTAVYEQPVIVGDKTLAKIRAKDDQVTVLFTKGALKAAEIKQLHILLKEFLGK